MPRRPESILMVGEKRSGSSSAPTLHASRLRRHKGSHRNLIATVYIESSVISDLASRPRRDLVVAARPAITAERRDARRRQYDLFIATLVEDEISKGDPKAARTRLALVDEVTALDITDQANLLAKDFIALCAVPTNSEEDALRI